MSDIQDTLWKLFQSTGKLSYYEMFRAVNKKEEK